MSHINIKIEIFKISRLKFFVNPVSPYFFRSSAWNSDPAPCHNACILVRVCWCGDLDWGRSHDLLASEARLRLLFRDAPYEFGLCAHWGWSRPGLRCLSFPPFARTTDGPVSGTRAGRQSLTEPEAQPEAQPEATGLDLQRLKESYKMAKRRSESDPSNKELADAYKEQKRQYQLASAASRPVSCTWYFLSFFHSCLWNNSGKVPTRR